MILVFMGMSCSRPYSNEGVNGACCLDFIMTRLLFRSNAMQSKQFSLVPEWCGCIRMGYVALVP
jgi:hypothetical protein